MNKTLKNGLTRKSGDREGAANHSGPAMKNGWEFKKLSEVCVVERGSSPRPIKNYFTTEPNGVNWIKIGDTEEGGKYVHSTAQKITPEGAKQSRFVKEGDFILTNSMSFGRPYIVKINGYIHDGWFVLRLKEFIDSDYFYYLLSSDLIQSQFTRLSSGAIVQNISSDLVKLAVLPIPPLSEQRRIVGILDEAFEGIATAKANAEKNLENARALFESHLQSVFNQHGEGWMERRLGDLATFRNGINFTKSSRGDSIKIVGVKDFQNNYWAPLDNLDTVTTDGNLPDSDTLKENDLLFVRSNGNMELIGRSLLVGAVAEKITHSGFTIRARLHENGLTPKYLCHFLKSNNTRRKMIDGGIGTNIKSLNQVTLSALVIPFPSIAKQARIVDQLEAVNAETQRLESLYQHKLAALDKLRKSLLYQAFCGEL